MAAYAALLSVKNIIQQIQHHPRPPISLDQNQVDSLTHNINFLQDFLEGYPCVGSSKEASGHVLESRIADAAHAAEDIIETRVVDQILGGWIKEGLRLLYLHYWNRFQSTPHREKNSSVDFHHGLEKVIQDMGFIKKDVMEMKKNIGIEDHLRRNSSALGGVGSSSSPLPKKQKTMIGFDDLLIEVMLKLTGGQSNLQIVPIVGMGGIGKTTLARNAYVKPLIMHHFDIRAWVTISQSYSVHEILIEILLCASKDESREILSANREDELGERVHKSLWGRRYLIVMDDIWSIEVWDKVQLFFPDNTQGSRIMITTRLSNIVFHLTGSHGLVIDFLDEDKSWDLLRRNIFEKEEDCPLELKEIGKKIAKNCKGLPLSIVVIGGLLAKSRHAREQWEYISENLNSIVSLEDNERCLKVLQLSYHQLPVHLKPCFLYMGVFREDSNIRVSWLVKLWGSEGFLKPISGKSLEVVSREYLDELCDRNLMLVHQRGSNGKIKYCNIHDVLRELCLREAEKDKFLYVTRPHDLLIPQGIINTQRRIGIHRSMSEKEFIPQVLYAKHRSSSGPLARSLVCEFEGFSPSLNCFRLLRVLKAVDEHLYSRENIENRYPLEAVFKLVNSRFLAVRADWCQYPQFPSSVSLLWNLQTLIVKDNFDFNTANVVAPSEIWKMPQLRHVQFYSHLDLPDPPPEEFVLGNLQTLLRIKNFKCGEEVVKRIPNINKLQICYDRGFEGSCSSYCLNNLVRLHKLESFGCRFSWTSPNRNDLLQNLVLPNSLKKLTLYGTNLQWEDMKTNVGLLPNLQVLKLKYKSFRGPEWETVEGQFCSLRFLQIHDCDDLEWWTTDSSHFPQLEHLALEHLYKLEGIPWGIGEIPTLQSIQLNNCRGSAVISAKEILNEQEEQDNVGLRVRVILWRQKHLESLASPNFQVETHC